MAKLNIGALRTDDISLSGATCSARARSHAILITARAAGAIAKVEHHDSESTLHTARLEYDW
jgi:hypothetical protein